MSIRDATLEDLAAIVEIYNASIPGRMATADTAPVTVESRRPWFSQHTPLRRPLWVAETSAGVSGWLAFSSFYGGRPAYDATAEVSLYVSPSAQRQGIGRRLLTEAIQRSPSLGLTTLLYQAFAHNVPSVTLATALGFTQWGLFPRIAILDGVERDLVCLGYRVEGTTV